MEGSLRDTLNRAQTNTWQEYIAVTQQMKVPESDDGEPPRGLSDDEELRRLGEVDGAKELYDMMMGNGGPTYE